MDLRWIVLLAGIVALAGGLFMSDSGMAKAKRRARHGKTRDEHGELFADALHGDLDREVSTREGIAGGLTRWNWLFWGAVLVLAGIFWNRIGDFLGQWFTRVQ